MISIYATNKPFNIEKRLVYEAYKALKSAGPDEYQNTENVLRDGFLRVASLTDFYGSGIK